MQALRTEMVLTMEQLGIQIEAHHHEVATGGQNEIDMRFTTLTRMADNLMIYKYVVKNTARQHSMTATFMPTRNRRLQMRRARMQTMSA